jgi:hypothetical protein
MVDALSEIE